MKPDTAGGRFVLPVPIYSQLVDSSGRPRGDALKALDCGETCIEMVGSAYGKRYMTIGAIRAELPGNHGEFGTSADDLAGWLINDGVVAHAAFVEQADVRQALKHLIHSGRPAIALGAWLDPAILHWVVVRGVGMGLCTVNDPWSGERKEWDWGFVETHFRGWLVVPTVPLP